MKSIFQSKTFWLNIIAGILGVTTMITADDINKLGLSEHLAQQILSVIGIVTTILNIVMRAITSEAVTTPFTQKTQP